MRAAGFTLIAGAILAGAPAGASAQTCRSAAELARGMARLEIAATRFVYGHAIEGGVTVRSPLPATYVALSIGRTVDPELDATTTDLGVLVGGDIPLLQRAGVKICPLLGTRLQRGPRDFLTEDIDLRWQEPFGGIGVAADLNGGRGIRLVPAVSIQRVGLLRVRVFPSSLAEPPIRDWITFERVEGTLGIIVDRAFAIHARVSRTSGIDRTSWIVPFARENNDLAATVSFSYAFRAGVLGGQRARD